MSRSSKRKKSSKSKRVSSPVLADPDQAARLIAESVQDVVVPVDARTMAQSLSRRYPNILRRRREVPVADLPIPSVQVPWYRLGHRPLTQSQDGRAVRVSQTVSYWAGDFYLQDAGSLLALAAAGADTGELDGKTVCDLCASPGGKASALLEAVGPSGFVLANEPIRSRLAALQFNLARTRSDRFAISCLDPETLADRLGPIFDLVLVDAPCSGQALLARGKQDAAALSRKQIEHSSLRQNRILDCAIGLVRPGGRLIYSTCTFAKSENESQVQRLTESARAMIDPVERLQPYQTAPGCYRLWPHVHQCAGSFAASMRIGDDGSSFAAQAVQTQAVQTQSIQPQSIQSQSQPRSRTTDRDSKPPVELDQWYANLTGSARTWLSNSILYGWPIDAPEWIESLATMGPELAHRTGRTWKPAHAASLRGVGPIRSHQSMDVDDAAAMDFLRGQSIACDLPGWSVVRWNGRPLGWVKATGGIGKNHLAPAARVTGRLSMQIDSDGSS